MIFAKCPNFDRLTAHNLYTLTKLRPNQLENLIFFQFTESFQPFLSITELKKKLNYVDPNNLGERMVTEDSPIEIQCCTCGMMLLNEMMKEHQSLCVAFINDKLSKEKNKIGPHYWYYLGNDCSVEVHILNSCRFLVEVKPGVFVRK